MIIITLTIPFPKIIAEVANANLFRVGYHTEQYRLRKPVRSDSPPLIERVQLK
jgi:hypothetical protein